MLALALLAGVMLANMSGNWIASKLLWLVLTYGLASATYPLVVRQAPARAGPPVPPPDWRRRPALARIAVDGQHAGPA